MDQFEYYAKFETSGDRQLRRERELIKYYINNETPYERNHRRERDLQEWKAREFDNFLANGGKLPPGCLPPIEWVLSRPLIE